MSKIYIVTQGYHSEYHICAVFSNEKDAEKYVKLMGDEGEVEIWDVDGWDLKKFPDGYNYWEIEFDEKGNVLSARQVYAVDDEEIRIFGRNCVEHDIYVANPTYIDMAICVWATDQQHAIKIATERRTIMEGSHPEMVENIRSTNWVKTFHLKDGDIYSEEVIDRIPSK